MKSLAKLKKIKGDASFREFYRNRDNKSIIVLSKKEKICGDRRRSCGDQPGATTPPTAP